MLGSVAHIVLLSLVPVAGTGLGAIAAVLRVPSPALRSGVQHFAGGVVFSVVAVELLPDVVRGHAIVAVACGFTAGVIAMLLVRHFFDADSEEGLSTSSGQPRTERGLPEVIARGAKSGANRGLLLAVGIDIFLDGLLLGIAFAVGAKEGLLLTLALSLELLSLGVAIATTLVGRGETRIRGVSIAVGLSLFLVVGAVVGDTVLHNASTPILSGVLAFGCAALLFLVTEELLVEAHEVPETPVTTAMFFLGFLIFLILGMLG